MPRNYAKDCCVPACKAINFGSLNCLNRCPRTQCALDIRHYMTGQTNVRCDGSNLTFPSTPLCSSLACKDQFCDALTPCKTKQGGPLSSKRIDFEHTYRRVHQAADLINYENHPISITKSDFIPKKLEFDDSYCDGSPESETVYKKIQRTASSIPSGRKLFKLTNSDPTMFQHKDCYNSSFMRVLQGNDIRISKMKLPESVTKADFLPKPFDASIYPFEMQDAYGDYEESPCHGKDLSNFINALENKGARVGIKKNECKVNYNKSVDDEESTFLRVMQAADFNKIDPRPISMTMNDFRKSSEQYPVDGDLWLNAAYKAKESLKNCANMLKLYKNLEASSRK